MQQKYYRNRGKTLTISLGIVALAIIGLVTYVSVFKTPTTPPQTIEAEL